MCQDSSQYGNEMPTQHTLVLALCCLVLSCSQPRNVFAFVFVLFIAIVVSFSLSSFCPCACPMSLTIFRLTNLQWYTNIVTDCPNSTTKPLLQVLVTLEVLVLIAVWKYRGPCPCRCLFVHVIDYVYVYVFVGIFFRSLSVPPFFVSV
jgi:hypothetical protein